jgi:soluble lytic murein transglycosylase-like protein
MVRTWIVFCGLPVGLPLLVLAFCVLVAASAAQSLTSPREGTTLATSGILPPGVRPGGASSPYVALAEAEAVAAGLPPALFVRQIQVESGFHPSAVSPAGAIGIAQFLPSTAADLGINPWNPASALRGAARLMASYIKQYQGDLSKALAAYNAGPGGVADALALCSRNARPWQECLPAETQRYLVLILA